MKSMKYLLSVTALAAAAAAQPAAAVVYAFDANLTDGPNTGLLSGTIDLAFLTPGGSGSGAASNVTITSLPAGIPTPEGLVATSWSVIGANAFTVSAGAITGYSFAAITGSGGSSATELCLNNGASVSLPGGRICPTGLNFIGLGGSSEYGFNFDGAQGITFRPISGAVPEPATWAMMILGFGAIGFAMRRRAVSIAAAM